MDLVSTMRFKIVTLSKMHWRHDVVSILRYIMILCITDPSADRLESLLT